MQYTVHTAQQVYKVSKYSIPYSLCVENPPDMTDVINTSFVE